MAETTAAKPRQENPVCPFCESTNTEMMALFGSQLLTSQYYCHGCRTIFEVVRHESRPEEEVEDASKGGD